MSKSTSVTFASNYFKPYIQVLPLGTPSPIFAFALGPILHQICVPDDVAKLAFDDEIRVICNMYRTHRDKHSGWPSGRGFIYHRCKNQTLIFDRECKLLEVSTDSTPRITSSLTVG